MKRPHINDILTMTVDGLGSSGEGVGHVDGYTLFVDGALPGEQVRVRLIEEHKNYGRCELLEVLTPSPDRVVPICPAFGKCGGCQIMHLAYQKQLKIKQQRVFDALKRIGKIDDVQVLPCVPSPSPLGYRNKIQLPVENGSEGIQFGLYARGSHELIEVDRCYIHCPMGEDIFHRVSDLIKQSGVEAYNSETKKGELRHLLIKSAIFTQEALVILVTVAEDRKKWVPLAHQIMEACPQVKGVIQAINKKEGNRILGENFHLIAGQDFILERLGDLTFKVSPASFFQVNPEQAVHLYAKALEFASLDGSEVVLDAYCGVGTLSLFFAKRAKRVIGVECVSEAIRDAKENARLNKIDHVVFECAQAEVFIRSLKIGEVDVVVLNPPRKGCELSLLQQLKRLMPKTIVYISCDPGTLARDLAHLREFGYSVEAVQPYDMFPQTAHVETVVKLTFVQ